MNSKAVAFLAALALLLPCLAAAQDDDTDHKGHMLGRYEVHQSFEFGGRVAYNAGNDQMYDTLVNLRSGPRLLSQELSMRSTDRKGGFFDSLYLSSFGFGGDPNNVARLRIEKNKWYNFVGLYRRDENFFDYNLWANPLNPVTAAGGLTNLITPNSFLNGAAVFSPHYQNTTRNMGDFNLTLFPQSFVSVRLGYSRYDNQGAVFSSLHETNEIDLFNDFRTRSDRYQFGVDVRAIKRTTISFDQFIVHDKTDNNSNLNPFFGNFFTVTGIGVANIGFPFAPAPYNYPCSAPGGSLSLGIVAAGCNAGAYLYHFSDNLRTTLPTSQLSLRSNYFRKLDITASGTYTDGTSHVTNIDDRFRGIVSRSGNVLYDNTGGSGVERIESNFDLGLTYHISKAWAVSDQFRWLDWRNSGAVNEILNNCFEGATPGNLGVAIGNTPACTIATAALFPGVPLTLAGNQTSGSTYPQTLTSNFPTLTFLGSRTYFNTAKLSWAPTRKFSAYIGYRYGRREMNDKGGPISGSGTFVNLTAAGVSSGTLIQTPGTFASEVVRVNEHTALGGIVVRPIAAWRITADAELLYSDRCEGCNFAGFATTAFTNISPRHQQRYRVGTTYKVKRWITLNASVNIVESRNDYGAANTGSTTASAFPAAGMGVYGNQSHARNYSLGASLDPNRRFGLDVGWTYLDQKIAAGTCLPVSGTLVTSPALPVASGSCYQTAGDLAVLLNYGEDTHTAFFNLRFKPIKRVTLNAGYELTSSSGFNNWVR
ncbi:MAG: hypothetical protein ABSD88_10340, partial [Candidatus Korobacteraceae bacterium]